MREADPAPWPHGTLLAKLPASTTAALLALGAEQPMATGRVLMREGSAGSHVVIIKRGVAKVTVEMADGRPALLSIRCAGDLLGELAALSGAPRSATVTMCGHGVIRTISRREFAPFLIARPEAAMALATMVGERLRWSNRRRVDFTAYPVRVRVARILTELAERHGRPDPAGTLEIGVRLTQPELATLCGAAEISVHKALRDLRQSKVVSSRYGRIFVQDLRALRNSAGLVDLY
jgi:CRP/FNR family cyclic AMP-dependent transcriptional regulator